MGARLATYDPDGPSAPSSDRLVARVLQPDETVQAAGYGDWRAGKNSHNRGKFFTSTHRILSVADGAPGQSGLWWKPWAFFDGAVTGKTLWRARVVFRLGPLADYLTVTTTAQFAEIIATTWREQHHLPFEPGTVTASLDRYGPDFAACQACGGPCPDLKKCSACGRTLTWPAQFTDLLAAIDDADAYIPVDALSSASDESDQRMERDLLMFYLRDIGMRAGTVGDLDGVAAVSRVLRAIRDRTYHDPRSFGDMPAADTYTEYKRTKPERAWREVCRLPALLARTGQPKPEPAPPGAPKVAGYRRPNL